MAHNTTLLDHIEAALVAGKGILGQDPKRREQSRALLASFHEAHRFSLENSFTRLATGVSLDLPVKVRQLWQDARLPYPKIWVEFDETVRGQVQIEHGAQVTGEWAVNRTGYLLEEHVDEASGLRTIRASIGFTLNIGKMPRVARAFGEISLVACGMVLSPEPVLLPDADYDPSSGNGLVPWRGLFMERPLAGEQRAQMEHGLVRSIRTEKPYTDYHSEFLREDGSRLLYTNLDVAMLDQSLSGTSFNLKVDNISGKAAVDRANSQMQTLYGSASGNPRHDLMRLLCLSRGWAVTCTRQQPDQFVTWDESLGWLVERVQPCTSGFVPMISTKVRTAASVAAVLARDMVAIEGDARMIMATLALLQSQWIERAPMVREKRGRWVASRVLPYMAQDVLHIVAPKTRAAYTADDFYKTLGPSGRRQRRHEVIGHFCHRRKLASNQWAVIMACAHDWTNIEPGNSNRQHCLKCGWMRWWCKAHEAGDASKGWKLKTYKVHAPET